MGGQIGTNACISNKGNDSVVGWEEGRMWLVTQDLKIIGSKPILLTESTHDYHTGDKPLGYPYLVEDLFISRSFLNMSFWEKISFNI